MEINVSRDIHLSKNPCIAAKVISLPHIDDPDPKIGVIVFASTGPSKDGPNRTWIRPQDFNDTWHDPRDCPADILVVMDKR